MSTYTEEFHAAFYGSYLHEPTVRGAHDWVFSLVKSHPAFQCVIDLGCGLREFGRHTKPSVYIGMDTLELGQLLHGDYRDPDALGVINGASAFVSLFSSEITAPAEDNRALYERIFRQCLNIEAGLVSGFYYVSRKCEPVVGEAGGIQSYQTLDAIEDYESELFTEKRITLPVPSKAFGQDVIEVWKLFERRDA